MFFYLYKIKVQSLKIDFKFTLDIMISFYKVRSMSKRIRAELVLILVTILWGISFPIIELSVKSMKGF